MSRGVSMTGTGSTAFERVIADPMRFKAKLAIGENAYASLKTANAVRKYWDLFGAAGSGAAVAKSTVVAATFFAPKGVLGLLGLGTASTPVGWVVAAAVLSGGAWYAAMKAMSNSTNDRVDVVPKFINTPLDVLGTTLFGLMAPLALKVAVSDGLVSGRERECICNYFVDQFGFDRDFVAAGMAYIEPRLEDFKITDVAKKLAEYKKHSPDCNYDTMSKDLLEFLQEVMESDGAIDEREELVLDKVRTVFAEVGQFSLSRAVKGAMSRNSSVLHTNTPDKFTRS